MRKLELLEKLSPDQNHVFHPQNWNLSEHYIKLSRSLSLVVSSGDDAISTDPTFHFKLLFFLFLFKFILQVTQREQKYPLSRTIYPATLLSIIKTTQ